MDGTSCIAFKAGLLAKLKARPGLAGVKVGYQPPEAKADLKGDTAYDAVWFGPANGSDDVFALGTPLHLDEAYTVEVVIQVMRPRSGGTQQVADARAAAILGEVLGTVASDPTCGVTGFDRCEVVELGWKHVVGRLETHPGHGSRFDVKLGVRARLTLT